ncbi:RNA polymerase, sigma-24 subunit, ECF subfamily [Pirellula staleyi DSM 6068]|uniref:RNA polymerase sigma factor n=1 Tax=Pirellula staleyi (strain ATCC 27377 / DSM 6068 / ICPB 4128) TaxID=530564 RepID=D2R043_PIRSD|nr:sigma-70 family RNA polymerase sigma factor [Pirellula staleyi]ADB18408.1 RNA polymerase, sigma-24 subunit, ECF subfamily [Pirellula staleyi DSM 6068]
MTTPPEPSATSFNPADLIKTYQAGIWRYLRALGCESALAEDLTQETFLHVLQRPFQEINAAATAAYLRKIALNLFISHQRRAGKVVVMEAVEEIDRTWTTWAGNDSGEAALDALRECLKGLTERARMALELRFRSDRSRDEIATALEITEHGAKNLMQRAKQQLKTCVENKLTSDERPGPAETAATENSASSKRRSS